MSTERRRPRKPPPSTANRVARGAFRVLLALVLGVVMLVGSVLALAGGAIGVAVVALESRPAWLRSQRSPRTAQIQQLEERAPALLAGAGVMGTVLAVDAIAHHGEDAHEPPVGLALLGGVGAMSAVTAAEYVSEHGDQLVWPAAFLGVAALAFLLSDHDAAP